MVAIFEIFFDFSPASLGKYTPWKLIFFAPEKGHPKRKRSYSNHPFSRWVHSPSIWTNIAPEIPIFPGKYHRNGGSSMVTWVYRGVINFDEHSFQMGWFNHQLVNIWNGLLRWLGFPWIMGEFSLVFGHTWPHPQKGRIGKGKFACF